MKSRDIISYIFAAPVGTALTYKLKCSIFFLKKKKLNNKFQETIGFSRLSSTKVSYGFNNISKLQVYNPRE